MTINKRLNTFIKNGFLPLIPICIWNVLLYDQLPLAFNEVHFNQGISSFVLIGEAVFRLIVFVMPFFMIIETKSEKGKHGFLFLLIGTMIYFMSWLALIYFPQSVWSQSVYGFSAPAYTPLIWLYGLSKITDSFYFNRSFNKWYYFTPSIIFSVFHMIHTIQVYYMYY